MVHVSPFDLVDYHSTDKLPIHIQQIIPPYDYLFHIIKLTIKNQTPIDTLKNSLGNKEDNFWDCMWTSFCWLLTQIVESEDSFLSIVFAQFEPKFLVFHPKNRSIQQEDYIRINLLMVAIELGSLLRMLLES